MPYLGNGLTKFTTADELTVTGDATAGGTLGVTGVVTANAGVVVDNITIDGTEIDLSSGDFTLDVSNNIILDSGDGDFEFRDTGTTFMNLYEGSNNANFYNPISDADIKFQGKDGSSVITALTLDMSDAGKALFNAGASFSHDVTIDSDDRALRIGAGQDLALFHDATDSTARSSTGDFIISNTAQDKDIIFKGNDAGSTITALTLDMSAAGAAAFNSGATFADGCTITTADNDPQLTLVSTDADANEGPILKFHRNSASPADNDLIGQLLFHGEDGAGNDQQYANIQSIIMNNAQGNEDGRLTFRTLKAGTATSRLDISNAETVFNDSSVDVDFRVESDEHGHAFFVDGEDGNISMGLDAVTVDSSLAGVSVPSGSRIFNINDADGAYLKLTDPSSGANRGAQFALIGTDAILNNCESGSLIFGTGNSESGRFNGANFLVGKTASGNFDQGSCELNNTGYLQLARDDGAQIFISRQGSSQTGDMIALYKVNAKQGSIGNIVDRMYIGSADTGLVFEGYFNDCIIPFSPDGQNIRDNYIALGYGSSRFSEIFCANSTINTSDETEKQDISVLTSAEMTAAKSISALFKTYKWKDAVAAKSGAARIHTGVVAQEVQKAMSDAGLDAAKYAFWCSDTWWEVEETTTNDDGEKRTRMVPYQKEEDAPEGATKRTRLGVRYPELLAFIGAATEQRLADIETRLAALEA
jgi:hypothetical protein